MIAFVRALKLMLMEQFMGYERSNCSAGARNNVAVLPTVSCAWRRGCHRPESARKKVYDFYPISQLRL